MDLPRFDAIPHLQLAAVLGRLAPQVGDFCQEEHHLLPSLIHSGARGVHLSKYHVRIFILRLNAFSSRVDFHVRSVPGLQTAVYYIPAI